MILTLEAKAARYDAEVERSAKMAKALKRWTGVSDVASQDALAEACERLASLRKSSVTTRECLMAALRTKSLTNRVRGLLTDALNVLSMSGAADDMAKSQGAKKRAKRRT